MYARGMTRPRALALLAASLLGACGSRSSLLGLGGDGRLAPDRARPDRGRDRGPTPGWTAIPPGTFLMGSPASEPCREQGNVKETQHAVTLNRGFELAASEVTQDQYRQATSHSPSKFAACGGSCPVEQVSWHQAAAYCNTLSLARGLAPCYSCSGTGADTLCTVASGLEGAAIYGCAGYRLPTEAEREYAYRAGTTTAFWSGPVSSCEKDAAADAIGWYAGNAAGTPHPVQGLKPNPWGLYDLPGNVWEWCHDGYQQDLGSAAVTDPVSSLSSSSRAIRGSSYFDKAGNLRAADRFGMPPATRQMNLGFRCARTL